jgi:hypothetical protein
MFRLEMKEYVKREDEGTLQRVVKEMYCVGRWMRIKVPRRSDRPTEGPIPAIQPLAR